MKDIRNNSSKRKYDVFMPYDVEGLRNRLLAFFKEEPKSIEMVSKEMDMGHMTLRDFLKGKRTPKAKALKKIHEYLSGFAVATPDMSGFANATPDSEALSMERKLEILWDFFDINEVDGSGDTRLHRAVMDNNIGKIELLLEHGADVNKPDKYGYMPLFWAVENDRTDIVELLKSYGAK